MKIGVLGGTGNAGRALSVRLAHIGHSVTIGSRSPDKAKAAVEKILDTLKDDSKAVSFEPAIFHGDNGLAADAELIIISTPAQAAVQTVSEYKSNLQDKVVISMCNELYKSDTGDFLPKIAATGSIAESIQEALPKSLVAAAFHHLPARNLANLSTPMENDVLICSDHPKALTETENLVRGIPNLRPLTAGRLANAASIEAFTAVLLNLSVAYKAQASIKISGVSKF